ncbi:Microtubule-associated protein SPIRAL2-like [Dendrobium catenatum]|uniref:Microtubule-associated protein SPIRAL2-like n=1 Tax=Dendrobium catenatum TaxID=906689 RepID=A0A2I0WZ37_9ASPA|nr:Microtubule-associated protein SPIRAL2-like [Dendrobium catenatum]
MNDVEVYGNATGCGTRSIFTTCVKISGLNLIDKANLMQCPKTARCNVNEGFDPRLVRHCIVNDMRAGEDKWEQLLAVVNEEDPPNIQMAGSDSYENQEDIMVGPSKLIVELTKIGTVGTKGMPTVLQGIHECLEIIDWATHKFVAYALVVLASYPGSLITNETSPIIESLEACCFDKVKPVRGSMMEALQVWGKISDKGDTAVSEASMERKVANFRNIENKIFDPGICLLQQPFFSIMRLNRVEPFFT